MLYQNPDQTFDQNLTSANVLLEVGARVLVKILGDEATSNQIDGQPVDLNLATQALTERVTAYLK